MELEHKLQIMRQMTASFHELSREYYAPLGQAAYDLKRTLARGDEGESSFFRLAKFWRLYERVPMLQLRCSLGEDTLIAVAGKIRTVMSIEGKFSEEDFIELQEGDINEKLADFKKSINTNSQLREVSNKYKGMVSQRGNELRDLMQCLSDIIFMEVTCGKEPWYKREDLRKRANETLSQLGGLTHIDRDIRLEVAKYYNKLVKTYQPRCHK